LGCAQILLPNCVSGAARLIVNVAGRPIDEINRASVTEIRTKVSQSHMPSCLLLLSSWCLSVFSCRLAQITTWVKSWGLAVRDNIAQLVCPLATLHENLDQVGAMDDAIGQVDVFRPDLACSRTCGSISFP
jgi:hypothetical protein